METLTINLPDNILFQLRAVSKKAGLSVEKLIQNGIQETLDKLNQDADFESASDYILQKNDELYQRLA